MIVVCEKCNTRFQLDDGRVPAAGANVRCSRCKHAFFIVPESAANADIARHLALGAALGGDEAPPATDDLTQYDALSSTCETDRDFGKEEEEEESDWEFNQEPASESPREFDPRAEILGIESPAGATANTISPDTLDHLGSPESWDLLSDDHEEEFAEPDPATEEWPSPASIPAPEEQEAPIVEAEELETIEEERSEPAPAQRSGEESRGPLQIVGWFAVATLLLVVASTTLFPGATDGLRPRSPLLLGGLRVEEVQGRVIENAVAGNLFVVSGRLRNPSAAARSAGAEVGVVLLGKANQRLAAVSASYALAESVIREAPPERLRELRRRGGPRLAQSEIAPGETVEFDAIFEALPADARAFAFELRPIAASAGDRQNRLDGPEAPVGPADESSSAARSRPKF